MKNRAQEAEAAFREGYNCSQAVAVAFADRIGLEKDLAARLVSGFGGGFGRLREVCGAVSGMVFVANALSGYQDPKAAAEKAVHYAQIQKLAEAFRAETGSIVCRELLGLPTGKEPLSRRRGQTLTTKSALVRSWYGWRRRSSAGSIRKWNKFQKIRGSC